MNLILHSSVGLPAFAPQLLSCASACAPCTHLLCTCASRLAPIEPCLGASQAYMAAAPYTTARQAVPVGKWGWREPSLGLSCPANCLGISQLPLLPPAPIFSRNAWPLYFWTFMPLLSIGRPIGLRPTNPPPPTSLKLLSSNIVMHKQCLGCRRKETVKTHILEVTPISASTC